MMHEQPNKLFYDEIDVRNAHSAGFYAGLATGVTVAAIVWFLVKAFLLS